MCKWPMYNCVLTHCTRATIVGLLLLFITEPSQPQNVTTDFVNPTAFMVAWQTPAMPNGVITAYNVWYNQTLNCSGSLVSFSDSVAGSVLTYTFTGLEEDTPYVFYVSAETSAGEGEAAVVTGRTREDGVLVCVCVCSHVCHSYPVVGAVIATYTYMPCVHT